MRGNSGKNHWKYCGNRRTDKFGRFLVKIENKWILEHRYVWEQANGKIPKGYIIHHIDGNNQNNLLSNLEMMTIKEHNRIHFKGKYIEIPNLLELHKKYIEGATLKSISILAKRGTESLKRHFLKNNLYIKTASEVALDKNKKHT